MDLVPKGMYAKAARTVQEPLRRIHVQEVPSSQSRGPRVYYYVLSQSQSKYTEISEKLLGQYKDLRAGKKPANTGLDFDRHLEIMKASADTFMIRNRYICDAMAFIPMERKLIRT